MHSLKKVLIVSALSLSLASLVSHAGAMPLSHSAPLAQEARKPAIMVQFQNLQGNGSFKNFTIDLEDGKMVAEDFTFEGLTSRNDLFEADSFTMRNVVLEEGGRTSRIGDVVMENVTFTIPTDEDVDVIAFLKAVAGSTADTVIINDVDLQTEDGELKVAELRLEDLEDGVVGLASLNGLSFQPVEGGTGQLETASMSNVHAAKLVEIFDDAAYGAERIEDVAVLLGDLQVQGLNFEDDSGNSGTVSQLTVNEIRGKQFLVKPQVLEDVLASLEDAGEEAYGSDDHSAAHSEWLAVIFGEAIQSDGLELSGLTMSGQDEEGGMFDMALENLSIGAGSIVKTPAFSLSSLAFSGEGNVAFSGSLASLEGSQGQFLTPEGLQALRENPPAPDGYQAFAQQYRRQTLESFTMKELSVSANDLELVSMPELTGSGTEEGGLYASSVSIPSIKLFMDAVAALGAPQPVIDQLGYDVMDFSVEASGAYDPGAQTLGYDSFDLTLADGGTLFFSGTLGNVPEKVLGTVIPEDQIDIFMDATIMNGELTYTDNSLANRLIELAAVMSGSDADTIRAQATAGASFFALQLGDPMIAQQISSAVATFIEDPQSLSITMSPSQPVPVSAVPEAAEEGPAAVMRALNVEIKANQ